MVIPSDISRQMDLIQSAGLTADEARIQYPDVVRWINENVSLVDLMRASGIELKPISPDRPDILVGKCPDCAGPLMVRSE
jgi:hypothetical protein